MSEVKFVTAESVEGFDEPLNVAVMVIGTQEAWDGISEINKRMLLQQVANKMGLPEREIHD